MSEKEILNQFFEKAIEDNKHIILILYSYNTHQKTYEFIENDEIENKRKIYNRIYNDFLEDMFCECRKIIDFYLVDIMAKGREFI